jgi:FAD/FMN-containing dehydrogenase
MGRPDADAGPSGHRDVPFSFAVSAMAPDAEQWPAAKAAMDDVVAMLRPHATGGTFLNFLSDPDRTHSAYTPEDYARLTEIKKEYDPDNIFHRDHNIPPAE